MNFSRILNFYISLTVFHGLYKDFTSFSYIVQLFMIVFMTFQGSHKFFVSSWTVHEHISRTVHLQKFMNWLKNLWSTIHELLLGLKSSWFQELYSAELLSQIKLLLTSDWIF